MARSAAWRGAIEFGGFPIHVRLESTRRKSRNDSFRNLAPSGLPVKSQYVDPADGQPFDEDVRKGVKVGKDEYVPLTDEAVETINSLQKSVSCEPIAFPQVDDLPLELATMTYRVTFDSDVAASEGPVANLGSWLAAKKNAYVTQMTMGSRDTILAFYVKGEKLYAAEFPFANELYEQPDFEVKPDKKVAETFDQFVEVNYDKLPTTFDHASFESEYSKNREAAIEAVLSGKTPEMPKAPEVKSDTPDLMATLQAAVKDAGAKKATKKPAARKSTKAKVAS